MIEAILKLEKNGETKTVVKSLTKAEFDSTVKQIGTIRNEVKLINCCERNFKISVNDFKK